MNLKKIVSGLITVAMVASFGICSVSAENTATTPVTLKITSEPFQTNPAAPLDAVLYKPETNYDTYKISFEVVGLDATPALAGYKVGADLTGGANLHAKSFLKTDMTALDFKGVYSAPNLNEIVATTNVYTILNASTSGITDTKFSILAYVLKDASVTYNFNTNRTQMSLTNDVTLTNISFEVNGQNTNVLTLGTTAAVEPTFETKSSWEDTEENKGFVWRVEGKDYSGEDVECEFSTATDSIIKDLFLNNIETEGTFLFDVILKTDKKGVSLEVREKE